MFNTDNDFDFPEMDNRVVGHALRAHTINCIAPIVVAAGITAAAGIFSALGSDDGPDYPEPEILPKTVSGNTIQDLDFLFDVQATEAMTRLTTQLNEWGEADRSFFESQFQPFQQDLISTNQSLLPFIERNATEALNQNVKDLLSSESLKSSFRQNITNVGTDIASTASNFAQAIDAIPGEEQRVGEAVTAVEIQFGKAGEELKRSLAAKGVGVSQASEREMSLAKAAAKAGATSTAAEAARREKLQALGEGVGVLSAVQTAQSNQLGAQQGLAQSGAMLTPQVGGVQDVQSVSAAGQIGADLTTAAGERILGQRSNVRSAEFTQEGVQKPLFFSGETGGIVDGAGNVIKQNKPAQVTTQSTGNTSLLDEFRLAGGPGVGTGLGSDSGATGGVGVGPGGGAGGQGSQGGSIGDMGIGLGT